MTEWIISLEGTEAGSRFAMGLAISAAFLHAVFGALQKGRHDPWLARGAIDFGYFTMAAPVAFFILPWPEQALWPVFGWMFVIHLIYKLLQGHAYTRGAYTVVYPIVRGSAPLFAILGAFLVFGETLSTIQWGGVLVLLSGIFGLAIFNAFYLQAARETLFSALLFAIPTGLFVALYTTYDAFGIRLAENPMTFLVWFFVIDGVALPPFAYWRWKNMAVRPPVIPLLQRGFIGGIVAFFSFGSIMLATRLDKVGEAAILRETSTVFAAIIGWYFLKETVGPWRVALMMLIAAGAVIVEIGS